MEHGSFEHSTVIASNLKNAFENSQNLGHYLLLEDFYYFWITMQWRIVIVESGAFNPKPIGTAKLRLSATYVDVLSLYSIKILVRIVYYVCC